MSSELPDIPKNAGRTDPKQGGTSLATELLLAAETYVWGLQGICQLHRIPFAPDLVLQQFPPPYSLNALQRAASALGLTSGLRDAIVTELSAFPVPLVVLLKPAAQFSPHRLAIVVKCDGSGVSYFEMGRQKPLTSTLEEFDRQFAGKVMLCVPAAPELKGPDIAADGRREF